MNPNKPKFQALLENLIAFDTTSSKSNLAIIEYLNELLGESGFQTQIFYNQDQSKANIIASIGPKATKGILFAGHTDVVPVEGQSWETPPFELHEHNDKLIGRGTCDMKGFIALVLDVLLNECDINKLTCPIYLVFTYDEEVGCFGAKALQEELRKVSEHIEFALIGEPTNFALVNAHKGLQATHTQFTGTPAHSSCPHLGSNAIMAAGEFLTHLPNIMPTIKDDRFNPPFTTFNVGTISGGSALNIIAEHCQLMWECRPIPGVNSEEISKSLEETSQKIASESNVQIDNKLISYVPGLTSKLNQNCIERLQRFLPKDTQVKTVPFVTEAGLFEEAEIPTVVFGPGEIEQAHQPNEHISIHNMLRYRDFLTSLISDICH